MKMPCKTAIAFITDGRDYLPQAIASVQENLRADFTYPFIIDDSGDPAYQKSLDERYPHFTIIHHAERRGLGGAVRSAWENILTTDAEYAIHWEDDFRLDAQVDIRNFIKILHCEQHLAQLLIKRAPWGWEVPRSWMECGGLEHFTDRSCPSGNWVESKLLFSFNPSVISRRVLECAVQQCTENMLEQHVTDILEANGYAFGCYGAIADDPLCTHIGDVRSQNYKW